MNEKLKAVLEKTLDEEYATLEMTENFRDSDFWDSLRYVNLVVSLQSEFKIQLKKEEIRQLFSVASIKAVLLGYGIQA
jgi:acyl carrier protein